MAHVYPFPALYYDSQAVNLSDVITPPYDVISPEEAKMFLAKSPYNFAHVILAKEGEKYDAVRTRLTAWKNKGILRQDSTPRFYVYQQDFSWKEKNYSRRTLMAAVGLTQFSEKVVLPHELTHDKPRKDRLEILRQTECNLSSVFGMVKDREQVLEKCFDEVCTATPLLKARSGDGILHQVWKIAREWESSVGGFFENRSIYILDGHHRYGSALAYAQEQGALGGSKPASRMFFAIANAYDPSLLVLPTHRCVRGVSLQEADWENLKTDYELFEFSPEKLDNYVTEVPKNPEFVVRSGNRWARLKPKNWTSKSDEWGHSVTRLSVAWTDKAFLPEVCDLTECARGERVSYIKDVDSLRSAVHASDLVLVLPPLHVTAICDVAEEGKFMPQKSTYFYPKLGAGLLIRPLKEF